MGGRPLPETEPTIPDWARSIHREESQGLAGLSVRPPRGGREPDADHLPFTLIRRDLGPKQ